MKIETDPRLLVIDNRPWVIALALGLCLMGLAVWAVVALFAGNIKEVLIALGCFAFVMFFVWAFVRRNQLILNATDGTATLRERRLRRYEEQRFDLGHVAQAVVETSRSSKGGPTHRMTLIVTGGMDAGRHPFTDAYTSGTGAARAATAVNDWLAELRASPLDSHSAEA